MVEIKPLHGLTYNRGKIKEFAKVITPPNDVISKQGKDVLEHESEFNFVKLILPEGNGNKYQNSAEIFKKWQDEKILIKDDKKSIYIYSQTYKANDGTYTRLGFSTTKANFGVPFLLYDDKEKIIDNLIIKQIENNDPYLDFKDEKGVEHKLWKITNPDFIGKVSKQMIDYQCIIADGHHRYTSDLKVKDITGEQYGLMCFVNSFNEGMIILPTNRIAFGLKDIDMAFILNQLRRYFELEEIEDIKELVKKVEDTEVMINKTVNLKNHIFGMYNNINKKGYLLKLKENNILNTILPKKTDIYKKLDINILHKIIIEQVLGITEEQQKNREHIDFIKGNEETIEKMKDENIQFCFFVNPPLMREVFLTARANETMPQKSTYFFPKVYSGLVTYKFEEA